MPSPARPPALPSLPSLSALTLEYNTRKFAALHESRQQEYNTRRSLHLRRLLAALSDPDLDPDLDLRSLMGSAAGSPLAALSALTSLRSLDVCFSEVRHSLHMDLDLRVDR